MNNKIANGRNKAFQSDPDAEGSFDDENFALPDEMYYQPGQYQPRPSKNISPSEVLNNLIINRDE